METKPKMTDPQHFNGTTFISLRDWTVDQIKFLKEIAAERDERYKQRFDAQEKMSAVIAELSDKAITKAEMAQKEYNLRSNEFRGALDDQAKAMSHDMLSRKEYEGGFKSLSDKIDAQGNKYDDKIEDLRREIALLREAKSATEGRAVEKVETRVQSNWTTGTIIAMVLFIISAIINIAMFMANYSK